MTKATPYGKDLLKPLADTCHKHGMKLGFYYSQAQDWINPGTAAAKPHRDPAQDGNMDDYTGDIAVPQVKEILSNYGQVAVPWRDTPYDMTKKQADMLAPLAALQPGIITNDRLDGGCQGDTDTPEQRIPDTGIPGRHWEVCMTMNDTWGFKTRDHNWKSAESLIRNLVDIVSKGGNYLLNVGPTSEGLVPQPSIDRLREIGAWIKINGQAIYGATASPFGNLTWGRCTKKPSERGVILYSHVFEWPSDGGLVVRGLKSNVARAYLLAKPSVALLTKSTKDGVIVYVPDTAPDSISSTAALELEDGLRVEQ